MGNLLNQLYEITRIDEAPVGDILRKQKSIHQLFPSFDDRVDAVSAAGGIRLVEEGDDTWRFEIASATIPGHKYHATLNFADIGKEIYDKAQDKRLWNKAGDHVDYNKLAKAIIDDVDVKVDHPDCPAYQYWGQKYINTQRDTAYHDPENRVPKIRNPKQYGSLCKHLQLLFDQLPFYTGTFAKMLKRYHADHVAEVEGQAQKTGAAIKKAATGMGVQRAAVTGPTTIPPEVMPDQFKSGQADKLKPEEPAEEIPANNDVVAGVADTSAKPVEAPVIGVKPATGEKSEEDIEKEEKDRMAAEGGIAESTFKGRLGKCYQLAGRHVMDNPDHDLVHGSVQRDPYPRNPHAWTEYNKDLEFKSYPDKVQKHSTRMVYDPVMDQHLPADAYYGMMNAKANKTYTSEEARKKALDTGMWAAWGEPHEKFKKGYKQSESCKYCNEISTSEICSECMQVFESNDPFGNSTGISNYDMPFQQADYARERKNLMGIKVEIKPMEYFEIIVAGFGQSSVDQMLNYAEGGNTEELAQLIKKGTKLDRPVLEYRIGGHGKVIFAQEGRHRMKAAMDLGYETVPVAVIVPAKPEDREQAYSIMPGWFAERVRKQIGT